MSDVYFSSCRFKANYPEESERVTAYLKDKLGIDPIGCCRPNHSKLTPDDRAVIVCNNCGAIIRDSAPQVGSIISVFELIDQDPTFEFPDYGGEAMAIQDCWIAKDQTAVQDAVRSLMRKMNIEIVELPDNREKTRFCGPNLLQPCTASNAKLAWKTYENGHSDIFRPMGPHEQFEYFQEYCKRIPTEKVVCYCTLCAMGLSMGDKQDRHILELLFP